MLTISQILDNSSLRLKPLFETFRLDSEILVAHALKFSRTQLYTWSDKVPSQAECLLIAGLLERRVQGEPIAYIVGFQEFWSLRFKVTANTLIPRPETEHLVELALNVIPIDKVFHVLDLGTGSGAIAIAIASERPLCQLLAVDSSDAALEVAIENAKMLGVSNVTFKQSNWFESVGNEKFDLLVSNPPYIEKFDKHLLQGDVAREPKNSLVSGIDGLDDIRKIIKQARNYLCLNAYLFIEHGWQQANKVSTLYKEANYSNVCSYNDLAGIERITAGRYQKQYD